MVSTSSVQRQLNHPSISSYLVIVDGNIFFVGGRTRSKQAVEPERPNMDS